LVSTCKTIAWSIVGGFNPIYGTHWQFDPAAAVAFKLGLVLHGSRSASVAYHLIVDFKTSAPINPWTHDRNDDRRRRVRSVARASPVLRVVKVTTI